MPIDGNQELGYRVLFSHPRMVRDLCRGFLREEWLGWLDLDSLERREDGRREPPPESLEETPVWRVRWQGGSAWVYLLLAFQAAEDPFMALRMGLHRELLHRDLLRRHTAAWLPVAVPAVLYGGERPWQAARDALELFLPLPPALQRHAPRTRYLLLDVAHDPIPEAAGADNLVSILCGLERSRTPAAVDTLLERLVGLVSSPAEEALRRAWSAFLGRWFLPRRFPELFVPAAMEVWGSGGVLA
jgi:hypothetical protein